MPDTLLYAAFVPIATAPLDVVVEYKAEHPMAELLHPDVQETREPSPTAVF